MCAPRRKKIAIEKICTKKYIIKSIQPPPFMEQIVPTVKVRKG